MATESDGALRHLVGNEAASKFFENYWGKDFLHSPGTREKFARQFSWPALESLLATQRFEFPRLRMVKKGKVVPSHQYMAVRQDRRGAHFSAHVSQLIKRQMQEGAMLHIASVHEAWEPLADLAGQLERELVGDVQVNLHASLAGSKGFATHWDGHDVFVMQIDGRKEWRLFGFTEIAPRAVAPDQKGPGPSREIAQIVLEQGDALYVPRGYWHAAQALDDVSLHLTCAVQHPTGYDYLAWLLEEVKANLLARQDIPFAKFRQEGDSGDKIAAYETSLRSILETTDRCSLEQFMQNYCQRLGGTQRIRLTED